MSNFTKEQINDYADKLLIGLTSEEEDMIQSEFDEIEKNNDKENYQIKMIIIGKKDVQEDGITHK